jgi:hypothetical protein
LKDPFEPSVYHLESLLRFDEAAKLERGNANVRPPNPTKPAYKAMVTTVEATPETFHVKNRGITYFCERFDFDNSAKQLSVTVPVLDPADEDAPKFGIADGGHTFDVIEKSCARVAELQAQDGWKMPFVRVHFTAGARTEMAPDDEVVEALNTSSQVQPFTLDEYKREFDELKEALQKAGFNTDLVAFRENESKDWHVVEIIQRLACFLKERWRLTQPAPMYRAKGRALELYTSPETRGEFRKLYGVIKDVVTFPEFIQAEFGKGELIKKRNFAQLKAVKPLGKPATRPGTDYETEYKMDMAALLPMAAAFRELLQLKGDRYFWRVDPWETFRRAAESLYQVLASRSRKARQIGQLGMDMEYWSSCVPIVMRVKDEILESKGR